VSKLSITDIVRSILFPITHPRENKLINRKLKQIENTKECKTRKKYCRVCGELAYSGRLCRDHYFKENSDGKG
jgi:hypothetical protein